MASDPEVVSLLEVRLARLEEQRQAALARLDCQAAIAITVRKARLLGYLDEPGGDLPPAA